MRIAITAPLFLDNPCIGAVRARELSTRLARLGHTVTVFTAGKTKKEVGLPPAGVRVVSLSRWNNRPPLRAPAVALRFIRQRSVRGPRISRQPVGAKRVVEEHPNSSALRRFLEGAQELASEVQALLWAGAAIWERRQREDGSFDLVFSTYGPIGSLMLGSDISARSKAPWVIDFRDTMVRPGGLSVLRRRRARLEKLWVSRASAITAVSQGVANALTSRVGQESTKVMRVVPNGFSREHVLGPHEEAADRAIFRIGYTGSLYGGRRDLRPLFRALKDAIEEEDWSLVEFHYAGGESGVALNAAASEGMERLVVDHGQLQHRDALALQQSMDVLTVATWNTSEEQGILTGKNAEYLGTGKPIIALVSGEVPESELATLIRSTRSGWAFEEARADTDFPALSDYLRRTFSEKRSTGKVSVDQDPRAVAAYDYDNLVLQLERVFTDIV